MSNKNEIKVMNMKLVCTKEVPQDKDAPQVRDIKFSILHRFDYVKGCGVAFIPDVMSGCDWYTQHSEEERKDIVSLHRYINDGLSTPSTFGWICVMDYDQPFSGDPGDYDGCYAFMYHIAGEPVIVTIGDANEVVG